MLDYQWSEFVECEKSKPYYDKLRDFLVKEYEEYNLMPPKNKIFRFMELCSLDDVKVVIVGQDPYPTAGVADGLAFSFTGKKIPMSLRNIYKEIESDVGGTKNIDGDLTSWASQGVLLMNTCLTVRAGQSGSHIGHGWEIFTDNILSKINKIDRPIVFMLWGKKAQAKAALLNNNHHLVLQAAHPSPLANGAFFNCKHFSKANKFLEENGIKGIDW